jgi:hypothetical protein
VFSPVFGPTGRVDAVVATVRDITGRKAIETDLKQAKTAAERAAVVKDQFPRGAEPRAAHAAHARARGGVGAVGRWHAARARARRGRHDPPQRRASTRLIDDLLDLTRVRVGRSR